MSIVSTLVGPKPRNLHECVSEIRRELDVRRRCFGRWVTEGKIDQVDAVDRFERLHSALAFLEALRDATPDHVTSDTAATAAQCDTIPAAAQPF